MKALQLCTYASFWPRYVFVNTRVNQIKSRCGPPSGSLASKTRMSPNRSRRRADGREPDGASKRRKSTARTRSSLSLNDFLGVLSVVRICSFKPSIVIHRFARRWLLSSCLSARALRTCIDEQACPMFGEWSNNLCILRFSFGSIFSSMARSKTSLKTF
jgi:hypothetical protein